nr:Na+/H+ antiporter [Saccharopolyspora sp. HNM0983]
MIGALLVTAFARSRNIAAPLLLVLVGLLVSLIPGPVDVRVDPELLLTVVLPPLLYSAALQSSYLNFRAYFGPIANHGVLQVIATSLVIGWVAHLVFPQLPPSSALVLGAVVSPPDAVTASAIGRRLHLPRGITTVFGGESLINDAAALTVYRMAVAAVVGSTPTVAEGVQVFVLAVLVGLGVGLALGVLAQSARTRIPDVGVATVLSILVPFTAYLLAEQLQGSGVLAVISAGLYLGHHQPRARAAGRLQEQTVWNAINLLLESLVFSLIGLQLHSLILGIHASGRDLGLLLGGCCAVLLAVMLVRAGWMFGASVLPGLSRLIHGRRDRRRIWRRTLVLSWTGMRGVVTLAAAGAIPYTTETGAPFPERELIQLVAFVVTVGTVLLQGTTLPWLIRVLGVSDPEQAARDDRAEAQARRTATNAALAYLEELRPQDLGMPEKRSRAVIDRMKALVEHQGMAASEQVGRTPDERETSARDTFVDLRRKLLEVERRTMADERDAGRIDDEVLRRVLRELDLQEAALDSSWRNR